MARRVVVSGASQVLSREARGRAELLAERWGQRWAREVPAIDVAPLLAGLRSEQGLRAVHFTDERRRDPGRAKAAFQHMREEALAAMTLAMIDHEQLDFGFPEALLELGPRSAPVAAILRAAPIELRPRLRPLAWVLVQVLSSPPGAGRFGADEQATLQELLEHEVAEVRRAVVSALTPHARTLSQTPLAEAVMAQLEDPACQADALDWAQLREELVSTERLLGLLQATANPGAVWRVLLGRGLIEEAIAAARAAPEPGLLTALMDLGGSRGRQFLLGLLELDSTSAETGRHVLELFRERRQQAIVDRFSNTRFRL